MTSHTNYNNNVIIIYSCYEKQVFTAVTMKNVVVWDVALCRSYVNRRFRVTYHLHLQGRKIRDRGTSASRWLQTDSLWEKDLAI
jgi:hypothetical protein